MRYLFAMLVPQNVVQQSTLLAMSEEKVLWLFAMSVVWALAPPPHHNRFTSLFPGPPGWAGARRGLLDFMVQGKINRGRHTDHPAGRHSIRTNQCPPPPSPHFLQAGCPSCRPTNSVKALKAPAPVRVHYLLDENGQTWLYKMASAVLVSVAAVWQLRATMWIKETK